MVNYCCVRGCSRNSGKNKHLYFYSIPKDHRQEQWVEAAGRTDILDKPQEKRVLYRICSRHFSPASFKNKHLCAEAVPTLCLPGQNIDNASDEEQDDEEKQHDNITCDSCGDAITRFRYKCITCPNYDLCSRCEMTETHSQHIMLRIPTPTTFKCVDEMVKKWQAYHKEANEGTDSSDDDEPITKYVKNYDSGVDLSDDVKEALRNEVTRVLALKSSITKKKQAGSKRKASETERTKKLQKVARVELIDVFSNATEMVFADVNEIHSVGNSQQMDVKNELPVTFEPEETGLPMMQMKLSDDLSELMMEVSEPKF